MFTLGASPQEDCWTTCPPPLPSNRDVLVEQENEFGRQVGFTSVQVARHSLRERRRDVGFTLERESRRMTSLAGHECTASFLDDEDDRTLVGEMRDIGLFFGIAHGGDKYRRQMESLRSTRYPEGDERVADGTGHVPRSRADGSEQSSTHAAALLAATNMTGGMRGASGSGVNRDDGRSAAGSQMGSSFSALALETITPSNSDTVLGMLENEDGPMLFTDGNAGQIDENIVVAAGNSSGGETLSGAGGDADDTSTAVDEDEEGAIDNFKTVYSREHIDYCIYRVAMLGHKFRDAFSKSLNYLCENWRLSSSIEEAFCEQGVQPVLCCIEYPPENYISSLFTCLTCEKMDSD